LGFSNTLSIFKPVKTHCLAFLLVFIASATLAQTAFTFLHVPGSARSAALGGVNVSLADRDVNLFFNNPTLASDSLAQFFSANYLFYVADVGQAAFAYAHPFRKAGVITFGVQSISYGELPGYDATGASLGTFKSTETALVLGKSFQSGTFRFGANVKMIFSNLVGYRASALAVDVGGLFIHPKKQMTVGLTLRHLGFVVSDFTASGNSSLPWDVQVGTTFKPEHMPFRFSFTVYDFISPLPVYDNPADEDTPGAIEKIVRHVNVGAELLLSRNVNVLVGYNFRQRQELQVPATGGGAGVSFGFSAKIRSLEFTLSRSGYFVGHAGYSFSLMMNPSTVIKKKSI